MATGKTGTLYGIGVGPGDPELLTLKALRILTSAPVIAYPKPDDGDSFARRIVAGLLPGAQSEIAIEVPMRVERFPAQEIYRSAAERILAHLDAGEDVAVLCEGDPFFYGSFMYLFDALAGRVPIEVVPGVSSIMAAGAALGRPLSARNDVLTILPGPLPDDRLEALISACDAFAIMKLGRHFARVKALIARLGLTGHCHYCERVGLADQRLSPLAETGEAAPYFSMILGYRGAEPAILRAPPPAPANRSLSS